MPHQRARRARRAERRVGVSRRDIVLTGSVGLAVAAAAMVATSLGARRPRVASVRRLAGRPGAPNEKGPVDAPVSLLDFSSYTCPHCASFALNVEPVIDQRYVALGIVHFRFVHAPLDAWATRASLAVECAGGQQAFWPYHHELMAQQRELMARRYADAALVEIADDLGLDSGRLRADLASGRYLPRLRADAAEVSRRRIEAVPTFFINGGRLQGARPLAEFVAAIERARATSRG